MSSIWNYLSTLRTGNVYLARSGNQMLGTVIQHGINQKTVTVRTSHHHWNTKYLRYFNKHSKVQVHDQVEACVTGDKVIIKLCRPLSTMKSYFVKRIVKPFGRDDFYTELKLQAQSQEKQPLEDQNLQEDKTSRTQKLGERKQKTSQKIEKVNNKTDKTGKTDKTEQQRDRSSSSNKSSKKDKKDKTQKKSKKV